MYKIISDKSVDKLTEKVNALHTHPDSWSESGGIAVSGNGKDVTFYQTMVRKITTPLMEDLQSELTDEHAKILINLGADVNAQNHQKITPLMFAAAFSTEEIVKLLISRKADVNAADEEGNTPLTWAVMHSKKIENVQALINSGANVNAVTKAGRSILMSALYNTEDVGIIKYLIDKGADVNAKYDDCKLKGITPLMIALKNDRPYAVIKRLLDAGADVNTEDSHGKTAWNYAQESYADDMVLELLKEYGSITSRR